MSNVDHTPGASGLGSYEDTVPLTTWGRGREPCCCLVSVASTAVTVSRLARGLACFFMQSSSPLPHKPTLSIDFRFWLRKPRLLAVRKAWPTRKAQCRVCVGGQVDPIASVSDAMRSSQRHTPGSSAGRTENNICWPGSPLGDSSEFHLSLGLSGE